MSRSESPEALAGALGAVDLVGCNAAKSNPAAAARQAIRLEFGRNLYLDVLRSSDGASVLVNVMKRAASWREFRASGRSFMFPTKRLGEVIAALQALQRQIGAADDA